MYNAQIVKERLKEQQKAQGIKNSDTMMEDLGLNINIIRQMSDNKGVGCFALAKIADYLDCSVDYLLGRTDSPNATKGINVTDNRQNSLTGNNTISINSTFSPEKTDTLTEQFMQKFEQLDFDDKVDVMQYVKNKNSV